MKTIEYFSTRETEALSGLPRSMLDYLAREGVVQPKSVTGKRGRGSPRGYTFGDIVMLRVLAKILEAGISVKRLKGALGFLNASAKITSASCPGKYLVTDGASVYFKKAGEPLFDLNSGGQAVFSFVLELELVSQQLKTDIQNLRAVNQA